MRQFIDNLIIRLYRFIHTRQTRKFLFVTRLNKLLERVTDPDLQLFDREAERVLGNLGVRIVTRLAPLYRDLLEAFGWSETELKAKKAVSTELRMDALPVLEEFLTTDASVAIVRRERYNRTNGELDNEPCDLLLGREIGRRYGAIIRWHGDPHFVSWVRYSDTKWDAYAQGDRAAELIMELKRRVDRWTLERYRGKTLNRNLDAIDLKAKRHEDLVFPPQLGTKIGELLTAFRNWHAGERVLRWGYILIGPPGTGKTTVGALLNAAKPAHVTFLYCPAAELTHPEHIRELFRLARLLAPSVVQIDDVDLIAKNRHRSEGDRESVVQLTSTLMEELDGLESAAKIFTLLTTNDPAGMDDAVVNRAGRVSRKIVFGGYGECMADLLIRYLSEYRLTADADEVRQTVATHAALVAGFTPDEAKNLVENIYLLLGEGSTVGSETLADSIRETHAAYHADRSTATRKPNGESRRASAAVYPD